MQWYICSSRTPEPDAIQTLNTFQKLKEIHFYEGLFVYLNAAMTTNQVTISVQPIPIHGGWNELTTHTAHARVGTVVHTQLI